MDKKIKSKTVNATRIFTIIVILATVLPAIYIIKINPNITGAFTASNQEWETVVQVTADSSTEVVRQHIIFGQKLASCVDNIYVEANNQQVTFTTENEIFDNSLCTETDVVFDNIAYNTSSTSQNIFTVSEANASNIVLITYNIYYGKTPEVSAIPQQTEQEQTAPQVELEILLQDLPKITEQENETQTNITSTSFGAAAQPFASISANIDSCSAITSSGGYTLTQSIANSGATVCMNITASNVELNCQSNTIDGADGAGTVGINATNLGNVTIRNCLVTDWEIGIMLYSVNSSVLNTTVQSTTLSGIDVVPTALTPWITNVTIANNTVTNNAANGIRISSTNNSRILENTVNSNAPGLLLTQIYFSNLINNSIKHNTGTGGISISTATGNILINNTAQNNTPWDFISQSTSPNNTITNLNVGPILNFESLDIALKNQSVSLPADPTGLYNISKYINATNMSANAFLFLNISYADSSLIDIVEGALAIARYNGSTWATTPSTFASTSGVDTSNNYVYANITNFGSIFVPLGQSSQISSCTNITVTADYNLTASITNSAQLQCMLITASNTVLNCRGNTIDGTDTVNTIGINATGLTNITVKNCILTDWARGIQLFTNNSIIENNTVTSTVLAGFYIESNNTKIIYNNLSWNDAVGIQSFSDFNNNITGNIINNNSRGISGTFTNATIFGNTINNNTDAGIRVLASPNNTIVNNTANSNLVYGIWLEQGAIQNLVTNNTANFNGDTGILVNNSNSNSVINNTASSNSNIGIAIRYSNSTLVSNNTANSNTNEGLSILTAFNNIIYGNNLNSNRYGIFSSSGNNNNITNNSLNSNSIIGIWLTVGSSNNRLTNNTAKSNTIWDFLSQSGSNNTIATRFDTGVVIDFVAQDAALKNQSTNIPANPAGFSNIGKYINATNMSANAFLFLNISYADADVPSGVSEASLNMSRYNETTWFTNPTTFSNIFGVGTSNNYVYANITNFSIFAPLAQDDTAPTIDFVSPTNTSGINMSLNRLTINVTASDTNFANTTMRLFNSTNLINTTITTSTNLLISYFSLASDLHRFNATAIDTAGNTNTTETRTVTIDTATPTVTFVSPTPGSAWQKISGPFFFNATATDALTFITGCRERLNGGPTTFDVNITMFGLTAVCNLTVQTLDDGSSAIEIFANDSANNLGSGSTIVRVDTVTPSLTYAATTDVSGTNLSRNSVFVSISCADATSGCDSYALFYLYNTTSLVNTTNATLVSSTGNNNFTNLADSQYFFNVTIFDVASNNASTTARNVTIDATRPTIQFVSPTETSGINVSRNSMAINVTASDSNFANTTIRLFSSTTLLNTTITTNTTQFVNYTQLSDSTYRFNSTSIDTFGNSNTTETRTVTIDTTKPSVTNMTPSSGTSFGTNALVAITANVTDRDVSAVLANVTLPNSSITPLTLLDTDSNTVFNITFSTTSATGRYNITIIANDTTNNINSTETTYFEVTTPTISTTPLPTGGSTSSLAYSYDFDLKPGAEATFTLKVGDTVRIKFGDELHSLKITSTFDNKREITINSQEIKLLLAQGDRALADLNQDETNDLIIILSE